MTAVAQHQSNSNEHFTPPYIVEAVRNTMGAIDLDPASCGVANQKIIQATEFFSNNGLEKKWKGKVFLNPPGGKIKNQSSQKIWFNRLISEWGKGEVSQAVFIAFNLEIIRMLPNVLELPHCIPSQRLRYWSADPHTGEVKEGQWSENKQKWTNSPSHPTIIFYLPPETKSIGKSLSFPESSVESFRESFKSIGEVFFGDKVA